MDTRTAEKIFDARWALALLGEAKNRLRQEYVDTGRAATFDVLNGFLDPISAKELPSYEEVAEKLKVSVAAVKTLIHRLRKRNAVIVREEIMRTASDPADDVLTPGPRFSRPAFQSLSEDKPSEELRKCRARLWTDPGCWSAGDMGGLSSILNGIRSGKIRVSTNC